MEKEKHFRGCDIQPMPICVKITTGTTDPTDGLKDGHFHFQVIIDLLNPAENLPEGFLCRLVFQFAAAQSVQDSTTVPD